MTDREHWFRIVMGQEDLERLLPTDAEGVDRPPPKAFQKELVFSLEL